MTNDLLFALDCTGAPADLRDSTAYVAAGPRATVA